MSRGRVLPRGQVTLPREVRRSAGVQPGDTLLFRVLGPGSIEIKVLTRMSLSEALSRYRVDGPIDESRDRGECQAGAAADVITRQDG